MPQPPRRSFATLPDSEKERIRANIRKLEAEGVDEAEVERYLKERENLDRPGAKPAPSAKKEKVRTDGIPAIGKTAEGAHILPRMTITQPSSPSAAAKAHKPTFDESLRQALPLAGQAAKAGLREAAPDKLAQATARGLIRIPTDLVAGAAALTGRKELKKKALSASDKLASVFGKAETPVGEMAEIGGGFVPLEALGLAAVKGTSRIRAPRTGPGRTGVGLAATKAEAQELALLDEVLRETTRKQSGRALPAPVERKLLKAPDPEDLLAGEKAIPEIAQLVRGLQITPGAEIRQVRRKVKDIPREVGERFSRVYEALPENDPAARTAYNELNAEVAQQMQAIEKAGYKIEYVDTDPYKNSDELFQDLRDNRRMKVFKTGDDAAHPYMTKEQNNAFRAVHDFIAHGGGGNQFGKIGEENAFRIHASTLSPRARRALATETRGQNSWVNFGPKSHLPVKERPFAKQKAALWPEELMDDYDTLPPEPGVVHGPAIPSHTPVKPPRSLDPLDDILVGAERERKAERTARLFDPASPPDVVEDLLLESASKPRSVKDLGKVLEATGVPKHRRFTSQFMKGEAERLQGPRGRAGKADTETLARIGLIGGGILGGAAVNDDPVEGGLLGLGLGAAAGAGAGAFLRGGSKIPRSAAMQAVANQIAFGTARPPLTGMQITDKVAHTLDRWSPIDKLGEKLQTLGVRPTMNPMHKKNLVLSSYTRVHQALRGEGLVDPDTMQVLGPSLEKVFEPIGQSVADVQTAFAYLKARRDMGRLERMGPAAVGGDMALAGETMRALADQHPALVEFGEQWGKFTDGLGEYAVRRGLWTPDQWQTIRDSDAIYVPFRRMLEKVGQARPGGPVAPRSALNVGSGVQTFSGSSKSVSDLSDAMADYTDALIKRADRYALAQAMRDGVVEMTQQGHLEGLEIMTPATGPLRAQRALAEQKAIDALVAGGVEPGAAEILADVYAPAISKDNPMLVLNKPGGGKEYWLMNSPELVETMSALTPDRTGVKLVVMSALQVAKRVTTATKTGLNPGFVFGTNPTRDIVDAWAKSRDGMTFRDIAKGWYDTIIGSGALAPAAGAAAGGAIGAQGENSSSTTVGAVVGGAMGLALRGRVQPKTAKDLLSTMETMGGIGSTSIVAREVAPGKSIARFAATTRARRFRAVVSEIVNKPIEALETVASVSDAGARASAWKAAVRSKQHLVDSGKWTPADLRYYAASQARGATIDFGRKPGSEQLAALTEIVPFLNAALQGGMRYGRAWKQNPARVAMASAGVATAAGIAWALNERGENPLLINDRVATERAAYLHFPVPGTDTVIRLPLGQENGVIAAAVGYGLAQLTETDPQAATRMKEAFMRLVPSAYLPVATEALEIAQNRAFYGDRPIETQRMEGVLPEDRKLPTTRPTYTGAARVARAMGFEDTSPQQAEHMIRGVFGPFADVGADAIVDEIAMAAGEPEAEARNAPRAASQHPMNPARSVIAPAIPTRTQSEDDFYRTLELMDKSGRSLTTLATSMTGKPDSASRVDAFVNDPKRGGRIARAEDGSLDLTFARKQRAQLNEVREAEKALLEQWRQGEIDEQTYRNEVSRYRAARQAGYRAILRDLHDSGVTLEGRGNYPRP